MYFFKCITGLLSEKTLAVNVLTSPKKSWNLQKSTFILPFLHSGQNWVSKSYFQEDLRFFDCLIPPWLETTSIFVVIERIYSYQNKWNYLKNGRLFAIFFLQFWYLHGISYVLKKNMNLIGQVFLKLLTPKDVLI